MGTNTVLQVDLYAPGDVFAVAKLIHFREEDIDLGAASLGTDDIPGQRITHLGQL